MLKPAEIIGHLLIVRPLEFVPDVPTTLGPKDAVRCDVSDLNANNPDGSFGVVYRDVLWFGRVLIGGLRRQIGDLVLAWMAQGISKPGQNPPFMLTDAMGDTNARTAAQTWLNTHPEFDATTAPAAPVNIGQAPPGALPPMPPQAAPTAPVAPPASGGNGGSPLDGLDPSQRAALEALGFDLKGK
jgi:hypothetical protein